MGLVHWYGGYYVTVIFSESFFSRYSMFSTFWTTVVSSQGSAREIEVDTNRFNCTSETICRIMKCSPWPLLVG